MNMKNCRLTSEIQNNERNLFFVLAIITVTILSRILMFSGVPRWDSSAYYAGIVSAVENFKLSLSYIKDSFALAGHPTYFFTLINVLGEVIFPGRYVGCLLVNLLFSIAVSLCLFSLFKHYFAELTSLEASLISILLSVVPIYWGTFSYVNPDYYLFIFFVLLIYAESKSQRIMMIVWTIALCFTKETGWSIVGGYWFFYIIKCWVKDCGDIKGFWKKVVKLLRNPIILGMLAVVILMLIYLLVLGKISKWGSYSFGRSMFATKEEIEEKYLWVNKIGFLWSYIWCKLKQFFVLNFAWIPTIVIILSSVALIKEKKSSIIWNLFTTIGAFLGFLAFNCFYITYALERYLVFSSAVLWMIAIALLSATEMISSKNLGIFLSICIVILGIQTFYFIDPLSNLAFNQIDTGKGIQLATNANYTYYGDTIVNNYRFRYLDSLFDKFLNEIEYGDDATIIQLSSDVDQSYIAGLSEAPIGWDKANKKRGYLGDGRLNEDVSAFNIVEFSSLASEEENIKDKAVIYFFPYNNCDEEEYLGPLRDRYQISERHVVSNWGGNLSYYLISK